MALLVYFVHHVSTRINVDTVVDLVSRDLMHALERLTEEADEEARTPTQAVGQAIDWPHAPVVRVRGGGYLQELDDAALADWACAHDAELRLLVRPGDYLMPDGVVALVFPRLEGAQAAIEGAMALGRRRRGGSDLEHHVRQLVEVAVRALSPGVNDPITAISVLDQLGAALCRLARRRLPTGIVVRDGQVVLRRPVTDYAGLVDAMFDMIRQSAASSPSVLIRLVEVLTLAAEQERDRSRLKVLSRHVDTTLEAAAALHHPADRRDLETRRRRFQATAQGGLARADRMPDPRPL